MFYNTTVNSDKADSQTKRTDFFLKPKKLSSGQNRNFGAFFRILLEKISIKISRSGTASKFGFQKKLLNVETKKLFHPRKCVGEKCF